MTQNKQDILTMRKDLKERPYGVPQGYFDSFKAEMTGKVGTRRTGQWKMLIPYIAIAASFALLIAGGSLMMRGAAETQMSQEDYILFSDNTHKYSSWTLERGNTVQFWILPLLYQYS